VINLHLLLFNYPGSKRLQKDAILQEIPARVKTCFDPMAGSGIIPYELKRRGVDVIVNDISPMSYLYLRALFGNTTFDTQDTKKLLSAKPVDGYLAKKHRLIRPSKRVRC